jgi:hypothetical protein
MHSPGNRFHGLASADLMFVNRERNEMISLAARAGFYKARDLCLINNSTKRMLRYGQGISMSVCQTLVVSRAGLMVVLE